MRSYADGGCSPCFLLCRAVPKLVFSINRPCCRHGTEFGITTSGLATFWDERNQANDLLFQHSAVLRRGTVTVYYPLVRCAPLAIILFSFLALRQNYSWVTLVGIELKIIGGLMLQKTSGSLLNEPRALGLAVLAMRISAAY